MSLSALAGTREKEKDAGLLNVGDEGDVDDQSHKDDDDEVRVSVCVCFLCADRRVDFVIIQSFWGFARGIMEGATCSNVCSHLVGVLPE